MAVPRAGSWCGILVPFNLMLPVHIQCLLKNGSKKKKMLGKLPFHDMHSLQLERGFFLKKIIVSL